jgi:hypothetical protein
MIIRTCPYDKRDGTTCNAPAVRGYDGCRHHSRLLREQRRRLLAEYLLRQVQNKLPKRTILSAAAILGLNRPPRPDLPAQIPAPISPAELLHRLALAFPTRSPLSRRRPKSTPP